MSDSSRQVGDGTNVEYHRTMLQRLAELRIDANVTRCQSLKWSLSDMLGCFPHLSGTWRNRLEGVIVGVHLLAGLYTPRNRVNEWILDHSVPGTIGEKYPQPSGRPSVKPVDFALETKVAQERLEQGLYFAPDRRSMSVRLERVEEAINLMRSSGFSCYRGVSEWMSRPNQKGRDPSWIAEVQLGLFDLHQILDVLRPGFVCERPYEYDRRLWENARVAAAGKPSPLQREVKTMLQGDLKTARELQEEHFGAMQEIESWIHDANDSLAHFARVTINSCNND